MLRPPSLGSRIQRTLVLIVLVAAFAVLCWRQSEARLVAMGSRFQVNIQTEGDQVGPQVHPLDDGAFVVVWRGPPGDSPFLAVYVAEALSDQSVSTATLRKGVDIGRRTAKDLRN